MSLAARATSNVSRTAVVIAQARALETAREDRLFDDPLARFFVETTGAIQVAEAGRLNQEHFALRTRFFDDYLVAACEQGVRQVVLLAAGLDTRAFRLPWPSGVHVFEVDLPGLVAFKEAVVGAHRAAPACDRSVIVADLRDDWPGALTAAGFDPDEPTAWLVEGLLMYLSATEGGALLRAVTALSATGSSLAVEHVNQAYLDLPQIQVVQRRLAAFDATWRSTLDDPVGWLANEGWNASITDQVDLAHRHGRPVPALMDPDQVGDARMWLVSATR